MQGVRYGGIGCIGCLTMVALAFVAIVAVAVVHSPAVIVLVLFGLAGLFVWKVVRRRS